MSGFVLLWACLCAMALLSSHVRAFILAKPGTRFAGPPADTRTESTRIVHTFARGLLLILVIGLLMAVGELVWRTAHSSRAAGPVSF